MKKTHQSYRLFPLLLLCAGISATAQTSTDVQALPAAPTFPANSIEHLNYLAGDAEMPPFSDSIIPIESKFRQALFQKGIALRVIVQPQYAQNLLAAPVPADQQVYVGQRQYASAMVQPILTADLRQLHLGNAQFYMGGVWNWSSWNPANPKAFKMWDMYVYKSFGDDRVQMKAGYMSLDLEFVGFFVGGSTASGASGVYAVLPYEAGMAYFPLSTPTILSRFQVTRNTYIKVAGQRSVDPNGGPTEIARNETGFRFRPHGDKVLFVGEGGYLRKASMNAREVWLRAGYMRNTTPYRNLVSGQPESGNYCGYALMDYQLLKSSVEHPNQGLYFGGSFETAPQSVNVYARYFEARLYKEAPFRSRPADLVSVVASRSEYSKSYTDSLIALGKTVWRDSTTLTGSYSMRVSAGNYLNVGLGYVYGPAVTPKVSSALKLTASWTAFF
jgi:porin